MPDVVLLARAPFALTIMFHYLFPPLSIGLGALLVVMEGAYLRTGDRRYEAMARFFTRIFAVNFAVGVSSGIVMEMEFGTSWSTYSRFVGDVFGSALASEGLFAFFLESGFLAILVFGWDRVGKRMHFFSTLMVFLGSVFSSVWIVIASSWMHTPAGYRLVEHEGHMRAEITDFWAMVFNPSSMERLTHVLLGAFLLGAFFVMSVSAYYVLKDRHRWIAERGFTIALVFGAIASLLILLSGHSQASAVARNQPPKLAAFEGHYRTGEGGADLYLFGWPDSEREEVRAGVALPGMLSFLIHGDTRTPVPGLDRVPAEDRPPVLIPFLSYHLMVGLGFAMIGLLAAGAFFRWRGTLFEKRWLMRLFVAAVIAPYLANQAGWVATEVGRQPWVVYGLLRTRDAVSETVPAEHYLGSLILFGVLYAALFFIWLYVLNEKIRHGPDEPKEEPAEGDAGLIAAGAALSGVAARLSSPSEPRSEPAEENSVEENSKTEPGAELDTAEGEEE